MTDLQRQAISRAMSELCIAFPVETRPDAITAILSEMIYALGSIKSEVEKTNEPDWARITGPHGVL